MVTPNFYVRVLRAFWLPILAASILGLGLGIVIGLSAPPQYKSTALYLVKPSDASTFADVSQGTELISSTANNLAALATTDPVLKTAAVVAGLNPDKVNDRMVEVTIPSNTAFLNITATTNDAQSSAALANAVGDQLDEQLARVTPEFEGTVSIQLSQLSQAEVPTESSNLPLALFAVGGLALGAGVAFLAAVVRLLTSQRVRDNDTAAEAAHSPVIATLPEFRAPFSATARERLAVLLHRLGALNSPQPRGRVITVVPVGKDGSALNLAQGLADEAQALGQRVVLVDADLSGSRTPYNQVAPAGLAQLMTGQSELNEVMSEGDEQRPVVISAGTADAPNRAIGAEAAKELVEQLRDLFDVVVLTAPGPGAPGAVDTLSKLADATVLAVVLQRSDRVAVEDAAVVVSANTLRGVVTMEPRRGAKGAAGAYGPGASN